MATKLNPRLITSTITLEVTSIVSLLLSLVSTMVITRHFSIIVFGSYTLIIVVVSFLARISTFGLEMTVSRFIAEAKDDASKENYISTAFIIRLGMTILISLLAWFGQSLLMKLFGNSLIPGIFAFIPLLLLLEGFRTLLKSILQGSFLFLRIGFSELIASSTSLILLLVVVYVIKGNIYWLIFMKAFSTFLACGFAFISIPLKKRVIFHINTFKEIVRFGYPLQLNDILFFISSRIDTLVVAAFLGPIDIALYEIARRIPDSLRSLYEPFRSVYYPTLSKRYAWEDRGQASRLMNDSTRFVAFVTLLGTAIALLFGRDIMRLLFSEKYLLSAPIFVVLMINLSIALIGNVMGTTMVATGDSQKPFIINIFNAVASLLGSILFIPVFGLIGAAVANLTGTALAYPPSIYFLRKKIDQNNIAYLKPISLFCIWGLLVYVISPASLLAKLIFLTLYLLANVFLSIITREDIILLLQASGVSSWKPLRKYCEGVNKS